MGTLPRHPLLVVLACAAALVPASCSSSSSGSGGGGGSGPSSAGVTPSGASSGNVPASGTADAGELFPVYTNTTVGYSIRYPGGWRIHEDSPQTVRIARFGDAISIVVREREVAPSYQGYQKQLEALLAKHDTKLLSKIDQPATQFAVGKDKVTKAVIEQERPSEPGSAPTDTLVTYRYLFWKDGKLVQISMTSVKGVDNGPAWDLIASSFRWQ
jgi:hypothetical protein